MKRRSGYASSVETSPWKTPPPSGSSRLWYFSTVRGSSPAQYVTPSGVPKDDTLSMDGYTSPSFVETP